MGYVEHTPGRDREYQAVCTVGHEIPFRGAQRVLPAATERRFAHIDLEIHDLRAHDNPPTGETLMTEVLRDQFVSWGVLTHAEGDLYAVAFGHAPLNRGEGF